MLSFLAHCARDSLVAITDLLQFQDLGIELFSTGTGAVQLRVRHVTI